MNPIMRVARHARLTSYSYRDMDSPPFLVLLIAVVPLLAQRLAVVCVQERAVRVERQVLWGLPKVNAFVFTIRTSFVPSSQVRTNEKHRRQLSSALLSMTPASQHYKGVRGQVENLTAWLEGDP